MSERHHQRIIQPATERTDNLRSETLLTQLQRDIESHRWDRVSTLFDEVSTHLLNEPNSAFAHGALRLISIGNTPRLHRKALRFSRGVLARDLRDGERALVLNAVGMLAENAGKSRLAEELYCEADKVAPADSSDVVGLEHAFFMLRRGRADEAVTLLDGLNLSSLGASAAVNQVYGFIAMMRGDDVAKFAERLQSVARSLLSALPAADVRRYDVASRALHMNFYLDLQKRNWEAARGRLRTLERTTFVYCASVSPLDHTAASLASRYSLAQMEYAVSIGDERQARKAVLHLESARERARLAVGAESDLAVSLEFNQALGALWVAARSGEPLPNLTSLRRRVEELGSARGTSIPEATSAGGMLSAAITVEASKRARERRVSGYPLSGPEGVGRISRKQIRNMSAAEIVERFGSHPGDTGRVEVQIALLHRRIILLTEHLKDSHSDHSARRGLLQLVAQRRRLLEYLRRDSIDRYRTITYTLDVRRGSSNKVKKGNWFR